MEILITIIAVILLITLVAIVLLVYLSFKRKPKVTSSKTNFINSQKKAQKLRDLKKLLDEGIITKEVFDEKSKKYIEEL